MTFETVTLEDDARKMEEIEIEEMEQVVAPSGLLVG